MTKKNFLNRDSLRRLESVIFVQYIVPSTIRSFNCCTSVLYPSNLHKLPDVDDVMIQFYLNFHLGLAYRRYLPGRR